MRNITEIRGEESLDVLADIIDPVVEIMTDPKIQELGHQVPIDKMAIIKTILKDHKKSIIEILATLDGKPVKQFKKDLSILTLPYMVIDLFNDPELMSFFSYADSMGAKISSIGSLENTEGQNA